MTVFESAALNLDNMADALRLMGAGLHHKRPDPSLEDALYVLNGVLPNKVKFLRMQLDVTGEGRIDLYWVIWDGLCHHRGSTLAEALSKFQEENKQWPKPNAPLETAQRLLNGGE